MQAWTGEASLSRALRAMLQRLPLARWTFTTLGAKGAVMLQRCPKEDVAGKTCMLVAVKQACCVSKVWAQISQICQYNALQ